MQGNDLGNEVVPRILLVWEGLVAVPPIKFSLKSRVFRGLGNETHLVDQYQPNDLVCRKIWDITWRHDIRIEVVTWLGESYVDSITEWIANEDLPIPKVSHYDPQLLSRKISFMPQIAAIYDPDPSHQFLFGSRGRVVTDATITHIGEF